MKHLLIRHGWFFVHFLRAIFLLGIFRCFRWHNQLFHSNQFDNVGLFCSLGQFYSSIFLKVIAAVLWQKQLAKQTFESRPKYTTLKLNLDFSFKTIRTNRVTLTDDFCFILVFLRVFETFLEFWFCFGKITSVVYDVSSAFTCSSSTDYSIFLSLSPLMFLARALIIVSGE